MRLLCSWCSFSHLLRLKHIFLINCNHWSRCAAYHKKNDLQVSNSLPKRTCHIASVTKGSQRDERNLGQRYQLRGKRLHAVRQRDLKTIDHHIVSLEISVGGSNRLITSGHYTDQNDYDD